MKDLVAILTKPRNVVTLVLIVLSLKLGSKYVRMEQFLIGFGFDTAGICMFLTLLIYVYNDGKDSDNSKH